MLDRRDGTGSMATRIMDDPNFQTLVRERTSFGWTMSAVMLAVYLVFIFLAAFGKGLMSSMLGDSSISWGIALGLFTIVFAFALTGFYVSRANGRFDDLAARVNEDVR